MPTPGKKSTNGTSIRFLGKLQSASPWVLLVSCLCFGAIVFGAAFAGLSLLDYLNHSHKPVPKAFAVSAPNTYSVDEGTRMFINPDKMWAGEDGYAPMAPDTRQGRDDLDRYLFAWGAEGNPQLRGSATSNPALRKRLVNEGRIILLDRDTRIMSIRGGDLSDNDSVYVANGPYEGYRGIVFSSTLRPDTSIFGW